MTDYYERLGRVEDKKIRIPENCTKEDVSEQDKIAYEWYKSTMHRLSESSKRARGKVFTIIDGIPITIWEEPYEEYEERMRALDNV